MFHLQQATRYLGLVLALPSFLRAQPTSIFTGVTTLGCTSGTCTFGGVCNESVPVLIDGTTTDNITFTEITGEVLIWPETCTAECDLACLETGFQEECIGSAGFTFCPETGECIRPWQENCPFAGTRFVGPMVMYCNETARCNDMTEDCTIARGSATIGGPYLSGLGPGEYELPNQCELTCEGCSCVDENNCTFYYDDGVVSSLEDDDDVDSSGGNANFMDGGGRWSAIIWALGFILSFVGLN